MKIKNSLKKKGQNNISLALYSILIAILVWFAVSMSLYPSASRSIQDIRLEIGTGSTESGLSVISCDTEEVEIKIKGSRTQILNFSNENLIAYVDTESISTVGKKTLPIKIKSTNNVPFEIESVKPENAVITFDKYETESFPIYPKIPEVKFDSGKTINTDEFSCEPDTINITGPSAQLSKIASVYAVSNKSMVLDSSYALNSDEIQIQSEDGTIIDSSTMKFDNSSFLINIPVLTQKTIGMYVQVVNAPSNFNTDFLKFNLSANTITIASKNSQAEIPDKLEIGKISLNDLVPKYSHKFDINSILESQNCINQSKLDSVTVTLSNDNLATKVLFLDQSRISISNPPNNNYDYSIITQNLSVEITGPEDVIGEVTANDIIADVNLLNADISEDQFTYDVTFSCTKYSNVWATTNCKVSIQRTVKETSTATSGGTVLSPLRPTSTVTDKS